MKTKTNVIVITPGMTDTTSLYRAIGPYLALSRDEKDLSAIGVDAAKVDHTTWSTFQGFHIAVYQRPFRPMDVKTLMAAKMFGLAVVVDYDDDLFCVMRDNPVVGVYDTDATRQALRDCCKYADVITVSTEGLKQAYIKNTGEKPEKFVVVKNGFDVRWFKQFWNFKERKKIITWRGSSTHRRDCEEVKDAFANFMRDRPDYNFFAYGWANDPLSYDLPKERFNSTTLPVIDYHAHIHSIKGHLGIVPLLDNTFNRGKSNIGFIELVSSGHMCIAKDLPEFADAGAVVYSKPDEFYDLLMRYTEDVEGSMAIWKKQFYHMMNNLTLESPNKIRLELLKSLRG